MITKKEIIKILYSYGSTIPITNEPAAIVIHERYFHELAKDIIKFTENRIAVQKQKDSLNDLTTLSELKSNW